MLDPANGRSITAPDSLRSDDGEDAVRAAIAQERERASATDAPPYTGELRVLTSADVPVGNSTLALVLRAVRPDRRPGVWFNEAFIPATRRPAVERWARDLLGRGQSLEILFAEDLDTVPGLSD